MMATKLRENSYGRLSAVRFQSSLSIIVYLMRGIKVLVVEPHEFYKYPDNMKQTDSWIMITRNLGVVFLRGVIPDLWTVTFGRNDGLADMPEDWNILVVSVDTDGEPSLIPSGLCGYISKTMELPANPIN